MPRREEWAAGGGGARSSDRGLFLSYDVAEKELELVRAALQALAGGACCLSCAAGPRAAAGTGEAGWSGAGPRRGSERLAAEGAHSQPLVVGRERCAELGARGRYAGARPADDRYAGAPPRGVPAPAPRDVEEQLQDLQARLQAVLAELEACMQAGTLSLPDYVLQLRAKIRCDKQGAVAAKAAGRRLAAVRLLGHVKLMTKELAEAEASLPPAAAESNSVSSAAPASQQAEEKQY
eukprot:COSAG01_NODE_22785_length_841_cov_0.974394_1_plen_236_part_00